MNGVELIGLIMSQDVILLTIIILCFIVLVAVPIHWLILGKRALERGRVRIESMSNCMIEMGENDD
jgi:hypothetical protein